jgi:hypothetical protein
MTMQIPRAAVSPAVSPSSAPPRDTVVVQSQRVVEPARQRGAILYDCDRAWRGATDDRPSALQWMGAPPDRVAIDP